ncbi:MAG: hypothetical protein OXH63_21895 [Gemmatimonadetes bacterium]|nr:hypothetical protein [Gemmatimonadota bacterium]
MRKVLLWAMLLTALCAQADPALYGSWEGLSPADEYSPESFIHLSFDESNTFFLAMSSQLSQEEAAAFWADLEVEGEPFGRLTIEMGGTFHVQADSLFLEAERFSMYVGDGDSVQDFFELLAQTMRTEAAAAGEDLELVEAMLPPLIELMEIGMLASFSEEFRGPYQLDGDALHLFSGSDSEVTLRRADDEATAVKTMGWGQLKSHF